MKIKYFYLVTLVFLFFSCVEKSLEPINEGKGKPDGVTGVDVVPIPGGAVVSYRIPNTMDLLAVKAVYTISNGQKREAIASYYDNTLTLEGFIDTFSHEAQLFAISRAQVLSDPVSITFTPLESSLSKTVKTVSIIPDFSGATFIWFNEDNVPLTFDFLTTDAHNNLQTVNIFQSITDTSEFTLHGYAPVPRKFGLVISDNFGNASDTIYPLDGLITPFEENELDKKVMKVMRLDNDTPLNAWGFRDEFLLDDDPTTPAHSATGSIPVTFSIDLGKKTKLSRYLLFQRLQGNTYYTNGNPKNFDVYVCSGTPSLNGFWDEWTLIGNYTVVKPSGLSGNSVTNEDLRIARNGHEFSFPRDLEPVRYLRFRFPNTSSTWENKNFMCVGEFTFFGIYVE
jgi:hypothetical protein